MCGHRQSDQRRLLAGGIVLLALGTSPVRGQPPAEWFVKSGPVFSVGGGFLEERTGSGWTVQLGFQQPLWAAGPWTLYGEFGGGYIANDGDSVPVGIPGFFHGEDPPDDHVHSFDVLIESRLVGLHRIAAQAAVGGNFFPALLNRDGDRRVFLNLRAGTRAGGIEPDYDKTTPADVEAAVAAHFGHGHARVSFSTEGGSDPELFFGLFTSLGTGVRYPTRLGELMLGADVELGHDWFDLGDFDQGDDGLWTLVPTLSAALSY